MAANTVIYNAGLQLDTSEAQASMKQLMQTVNKISTIAIEPIDTRATKEGIQMAQQLEKSLRSAFNVNTGNLDLNKFSTNLKTAGISVDQLRAKLVAFGPTGASAFNQLASSVASAQLPLKQTNAMIDNLMINLKKTAQWQISSSLIHGFVGQIQSAIGYVHNLNTSLTNISVVSDLSSQQLAKFAADAQKMGKALSASTLDVTNAALIYFQQGDSVLKSMEKAAITIKAANASANSSAAEMSEYLTAIWNSYQVGSAELEKYVDIMAALGAKTATSMEEIATSMQKVAATANTVGVGFDQMSAIISTVSSVTRESAESVGTAYKTILARMGDLKLGNIVEDGVEVSLGQVSSALDKVGIKILDAQGNMRDMGSVVEEVMVKWQGLALAEKTALAQQLGGKRQYTQLMALFENADKYQEAMTIAASSEGSLNQMQDKWAQGWDAAANRVKNSMQGLYSSLIDDKFAVGFLNVIAEIIGGVDSLIDKMGGLGSVIATVGGIFASKIGNRMHEFVDSIKSNLGIATGATKRAMANMQAEFAMVEKRGARDPIARSQAALLEARSKYTRNQDHLSLDQRESFQMHSESYTRLQNEQKQLEAERRSLNAAQKTAQGQLMSGMMEELTAQQTIRFAEQADRKAQIQQEATQEMERLQQRIDQKQAEVDAAQQEVAKKEAVAQQHREQAQRNRELADNATDQRSRREFGKQAKDEDFYADVADEDAAAARAALQEKERQLAARKAERETYGRVAQEKTREVDELIKTMGGTARDASATQGRELIKQFDDALDARYATEERAATRAREMAKAREDFNVAATTEGKNKAKQQAAASIQAEIDILQLKPEEIEKALEGAEGWAIIEGKIVFSEEATAEQMAKVQEQIDAAAAEKAEEGVTAARTAILDQADDTGKMTEKLDAYEANAELRNANKENRQNNESDQAQLKGLMDIDTEPIFSAADAFGALGGAIGSVIGIGAGFKGVWDAIADPDMSGIEKATAILTGLMTILMSASGAAESFGTLIKVGQNMAEKATKKNTAATMQNTGATVANTVAEQANAQAHNQGAQAMNNDTQSTNQNTGSNLTNATSGKWGKLGTSLKGMTKAGGGQGIFKSLLGGLKGVMKGIGAMFKGIITSITGAIGTAGAAVLGVVAAIAAVIIGSFVIYNNQLKALKEEQTKLKEESEKLAKEQEASANKLASASAIINNDNMSTQEQIDALNELGEAYGISVSAVDAMSGSYASYTAQLQAAILAEQQLLQIQLEKNKNKLAENSIELASKDSDNALDWLNTGIAAVGGALSWTGQGLWGLITGKGFSEFNSENYHDWYDDVKVWERTALDDFASDGGAEKGSTEEAKWTEFATKNKDRLAEIGMYWDPNKRTLRQSRELEGEDYKALYDMMVDAGAKDWGGDYTQRFFAEMEGDWGFDLVDNVENSIRQSQIIESLLTQYSDVADIMNVQNRNRSLQDLSNLMTKVKATSVEDQKYLAEYLTQYSHWSDAGLQYQAIIQKAESIESMGQANGLNAGQITNSLINAITDGQDGLTLDLVLKLNPTAITIDEEGGVHIRETAKAAAQAELDREKYVEVEAQIKELEAYANKEQLTKADYDAIVANGLFTGAELDQFTMGSAATRALMLEQKRLENDALDIETLQNQIDTNQADLEALNQKREEYFKELANDAVKKLTPEQLSYLEGGQNTEDLYNNMIQRRNKLNQQVTYRNTYGGVAEFKDIEDKDAYKKAALAAMTAEQYETYKDKTAEEIFNDRDTWGSGGIFAGNYDELNALNELLEEGVQITAEYAEKQAAIAEAQGDLETAEWWRNVGKAMSDATTGAEAFGKAIGQSGQMAADTLTTLMLLDEYALRNYQNMSSDEWDQWSYKKAMEYYDALLAYYDEDTLDYALALDKKRQLTENYNKSQEEKNEAVYERMAQEYEDYISDLEEITGVLANLTSGESLFSDLSFEQIELLRQKLEEVGYTTEQVDALLRSLGKGEQLDSKDSILAAMRAEVDMLLNGISATEAQKELRYGDLSTELVVKEVVVSPDIPQDGEGGIIVDASAEAAVNAIPGNNTENSTGNSGGLKVKNLQDPDAANTTVNVTGAEGAPIDEGWKVTDLGEPNSGEVNVDVDATGKGHVDNTSWHVKSVGAPGDVNVSVGAKGKGVLAEDFSAITLANVIPSNANVEFGMELQQTDNTGNTQAAGTLYLGTDGHLHYVSDGVAAGSVYFGASLAPGESDQADFVFEGGKLKLKTSILTASGDTINIECDIAEKGEITCDDDGKLHLKGEANGAPLDLILSPNGTGSLITYEEGVGWKVNGLGPNGLPISIDLDDSDLPNFLKNLRQMTNEEKEALDIDETDGLNATEIDILYTWVPKGVADPTEGIPGTGEEPLEIKYTVKEVGETVEQAAEESARAIVSQYEAMDDAVRSNLLGEINNDEDYVDPSYGTAFGNKVLGYQTPTQSEILDWLVSLGINESYQDGYQDIVTILSGSAGFFGRGSGDSISPVDLWNHFITSVTGENAMTTKEWEEWMADEYGVSSRDVHNALALTLTHLLESGAFGEIGSEAYDMGANLLKGMLIGYTDQELDAFALVGPQILAIIRTSLAEASPSKATIEMGKYLMEGLNIGWNNAKFEVGNVKGKILDAIANELKGIDIKDIKNIPVHVQEAWGIANGRGEWGAKVYKDDNGYYISPQEGVKSYIQNPDGTMAQVQTDTSTKKSYIMHNGTRIDLLERNDEITTVEEASLDLTSDLYNVAGHQESGYNPYRTQLRYMEASTRSGARFTRFDAENGGFIFVNDNSPEATAENRDPGVTTESEAYAFIADTFGVSSTRVTKDENTGKITIDFEDPNIEDMSFDNLSDAYAQAITTAFSEDEMIDWLQSGDRANLNEMQDYIMSQAVAAYLKDTKYNSIEEAVEALGMDVVMAGIQGKIDEGYRSLDSYSDSNWAKIKDAWYNAAQNVLDLENEAAKEFYDTWVSTFKAIAEARKIIFEGGNLGTELDEDTIAQLATDAILNDPNFDPVAWQNKLFKKDKEGYQTTDFKLPTYRSGAEGTSAQWLAYDSMGMLRGNTYDANGNILTYGNTYEQYRTKAQEYYAGIWSRHLEEGAMDPYLAMLEAQIALGDNWQTAFLAGTSGYATTKQLEEWGITKDTIGGMWTDASMLANLGLLQNNSVRQKDAQGNDLVDKNGNPLYKVIDWGINSAATDIVDMATRWNNAHMDDIMRSSWADAYGDQVAKEAAYRRQIYNDQSTKYTSQQERIEKDQAIVQKAMEKGIDALTTKEQERLDEIMAEGNYTSLEEANLGLAGAADRAAAGLDRLTAALSQGYITDGQGNWFKSNDPNITSNNNYWNTEWGTTRTTWSDINDAKEFMAQHNINLDEWTANANGGLSRTVLAQDAQGQYFLRQDVVPAESVITEGSAQWNAFADENNENTLAGQEYNLNNYASRADMTTDEFKTYADTLNGMLSTQDQFNTETAEGREALYQYAAAVGESAKGFEELTAITADTWKKLKDGSKKGSKDWVKNITGLRSSMSKLFNTDMKHITADFVEDHLDELEKMATGTEEEAAAAQEAIQDDLIAAVMKADGLEATTLINAETGEAENALTYLQTKLDQWDGQEVGFTIDANTAGAEANVIASLQSMLNAGTMTAEQISAALNAIGWEPEISYETVTVTGIDSTNSTATVTDSNGKSYTVKAQQGMVVNESFQIPIIGSAKKISSPGGGMRPESSGGGGGGGKPKKTDLKKPEDEKERYHEITKTLERMGQLLDGIGKMKERAFGKAHLKNIDQEIAMLKKQEKAYEAYYAEAQKYWEQDMAKMAAEGATFDEYGNIDNYNELMDQWIAEYNAVAEAYNAMSAGEQKKADEDEMLKKAEEKLEDRKKLMEDYEDSVNKAYEQWNNILDIQNQISAANLEKIQYKIEYQVKMNEDDIKLLEYFDKKWEESLDRQDDRLSGYVEQSAKLQDNLNILAEAHKELDAAYAAGDINAADYVEGLRDVRDQILENLEAYEDLKKSISELYTDTLDMIDEKVQRQTDHIVSASEAMASYITLLGLMGRGKNFRELEQFYQKQTEFNIDNLEALKLEQDFLMRRKQYYEDLMASGVELNKLDQENYEETLTRIDETTEELLSATEEALNSIQESYSNAISAIAKEWSEAMGGVAGSIEGLADSYSYYSEAQGRYVSSAKELYEVSKLNREIEQSIQDTTTTASKQMLQALKERINAQSELNELTEYDIEMNRLQYELALAKIGLEEAQNAKDTVRLTRDESGNYIYQYTANDDKINEAMQKYEDVLQQINELAANRTAELEQMFIDAQQTYYEKAQEIANDTTLTMEERALKYQEIYAQYCETVGYIQEQYGNVTGHLMESNLTISQHYNDTLTGQAMSAQEGINLTISEMIGDTEMYKEAMKTAIDEMIAADDEHQKKIQEVASVSQLSYTDMIKNLDDYAKKVDDAGKKVADVLGADSETEGMIDQIQTMTTAWGNMAQTIDDKVVPAMERIIQTINEAIRAMADLENQANQDYTPNVPTPPASTQTPPSNTKPSTPSGTGGSGGTGGNQSKPKPTTVSLNIISKSTSGTTLSSTVRTGLTPGVSVSPFAFMPSTPSGYKYKGCSPSGNFNLPSSGSATIVYTYESIGGSDHRSTLTSSSPNSRYSVTAYATGGLNTSTGPAWLDGTKDRPELVLNAHDTQNMLSAVGTLRELDTDSIALLVATLNAATSSMFSIMSGNLSASGVYTSNNQSLNQNVEIHADFPNVTDKNEIIDAIDDLVNRASQYAQKKMW